MTEIQSPPAETDEETPRSGAEILLQIVNSLGDLCQIGAHALQKREAEVAWLEERVHAARSEREELAIFTQGLQKLTDYLNDHLPLLEEGTLSGESPELTEIQQAYEEARAQAEELTQELEMTVFERDSLFEELQERSKSLSSLEKQARAWAAEAVDGAVFDDEALDEDEEDLDAALDRDFASIQQHNPAQMPDAVSEDDNLMADLLDDEEETSESSSREADAHDGAATEDNQESAEPDSEPDESDVDDGEAEEITNAISFREDIGHSDGVDAQHEAADTETDSASEKEPTAIASDEEAAAEGDEETPQAQSAQVGQNEETVDISPDKSDAVAEEASGNQDGEDGNTGEEGVSAAGAPSKEDDGEPDDAPAQPETEPEKAETETEAGDEPTPEISAVDEADDVEMAQSNDEATGLTSNEAEGGDAEADDGQVMGAEAERSLAAAEETNEASEEDAEAAGDTGGNEVSGERALDAPEPLAASPIDDLLPSSIDLDDEDLAVASSDTAEEGQSAEPLPAPARDETAEQSALVVSAQDEDEGEGAEHLDIPAPIAPAPLLLDDLDEPAATEE